MTSSPSSSQAASQKSTKITHRGRHFVDEHHRVVSLRGFNISAASKLPTTPNGLDKIDAETWFDHRNVSFVDRPFPLDEAEGHFRRILEWGYPFVRLLITWEALSHRGPALSDVDLEYVAYVKELLNIAGKVGVKVVVSSHQDVWSRLCGGSGAPGWTLELAGFDIRAFHDTKAAYVHNLDDDAVDASVVNGSLTNGSHTKGNHTNGSHTNGNHTNGKLNGHSKANGGVHHNTAAKDPREISGPFVWPSGYQKLAAATMATLFWAGSIFAWKERHTLPDDFDSGVEVDVSVQELLQSSYLNAFGLLADEVGDCEAVIGFELQNEPHRGFIELHGWHKWCYETDLHIGHYPSLLQSLALGSGYAQDVPYYVKSWPFPTKVSHHSRVDPQGRSVWSSGKCLWRSHGAWDWDKDRGNAVVLEEDFFTKDPRPNGGTPDQKVEWYRDCYAPFVTRFSERLRRKHSNLQLWFEPIPNEFHPPWPSNDMLDKLNEDEREMLRRASLRQRYASQTHIQTPRPSNIIYAPHFYDLNVLFSKVYKGMSVNVQGLSRGMFILKALYFGEEGLRKNYVTQLSKLVSLARSSLGEIPIVIGEIGIPFDVNKGHGLKTGDYTTQTRLLDALANGMEQAKLAGWTWWNYNPNSTIGNGDYWNKEDFSMICYESQDVNLRSEFQSDDLYRGGRCLDAIIRPYAVKTAGVPVESSWDRYSGVFEYKFVESVRFHELTDDSTGNQETELYIPKYHFQGRKLNIQISDGEYTLDVQNQTLIYKPQVRSVGTKHTIRISISDSPHRRTLYSRTIGSFALMDWIAIVLAMVVGIIGIVVVDYYFKNSLPQL
ncbi:unnamed protein product [Sympodiomycopsis kandeliae]